MDRQTKFRAVAVHSIRFVAVTMLLSLIPSPSSNPVNDTEGNSPPDLSLIRKHIAAADSIDPERRIGGLWAVRDPEGKTIASAARTLPEAADVIGYRGPSEALILVDDDLRLIAVDLIQSSDTDEHVQAVKDDPTFFRQFADWTWGGPENDGSVDAVSGATLTSLALAQGVLKRIGGERPSLVFPNEIAIEELSQWFPEAAAIRTEEDLVAVLDEKENVIGRVFRTGPLADGIIGYQGPTELLIQITDPTDSDQPEEYRSLVVKDITLRSSFDNQPYVRYCKMEYGFWRRFENRTVGDLADLDIQDEGIEGVSGATMTSLAIAETLAASADRLLVRTQSRKVRVSPAWYAGLRVGPQDIASILIILMVPILRSRGLFRKRSTRSLWLFSVAVVIGLWTGNLISLALIAGWSAEGVAWQLAPGLAALAAVAFLSPAIGKANPYCNHLCPHGAIQQLVRPSQSSRRRWSPPARLLKWLRVLPGSMLVIAYLTLIARPATDLSSWEPFHAYLFRIAPWTALLLWAVTLLVSAFVPMGYCRLGCPTGRLLDYLRRSSRSDTLHWSDAVVAALLLTAVSAHLIRT